MGEDSKGIGVLLEFVRTSDDDWSSVLLIGVATLIRSLPEKKKKKKRRH